MAVDDNYTKILLHMDGTNNSHLFTDETGKIWDTYGGIDGTTKDAADCAIIDTSESVFGGASGYFPANGSNIQTSSIADYDLGTGDFTFSVRFWTGASFAESGGILFADINTATSELVLVGYSSDGLFCVATGSDGFRWFFTAPFTPSVSQKYHLAIERYGNTPLMFVDGVALEVTQPVPISGKSGPSIGANGIVEIGTGMSDYHLDEFRFSNGIARWVAPFIPPTDAYLSELPSYQAPNLKFLFNGFSQMETPELILCKPDKTELTFLHLATNIKNTIRYNALSEITFDYPQSGDGGLTIDPAYDLIKGKKLVLVQQIGYYIINSCPEDNTGAIPIKHITALSLESELLHPRLTGFTGTYDFATLLQLVLDLKPSWVIGDIDSSLLPLYRTFDANNTTAYAFLTNDMEKAYGCVFKFDTFNKAVYAVSNVVPAAQTNTYLSFNNIIKSIQFREITEEICTGLYCYGGDNLDIRDVNPLGGAEIFDFSYYETNEWMSAGLIDAIHAWEVLVIIQQPIYAEELTDLKAYNISMTSLLSDLAELNSQLASMIIAGAPAPDIAAQRILIASKEIDILAMQSNINNVEITLRKIVHGLFFTSEISFHNFSEDLATILEDLRIISTNWKTTYNPASTYPDFNPTLLATLTPIIEAGIANSIEEVNEIVSAVNVLAFPTTISELDSLDILIDDAIGVLNTLYANFQSLIPATDETTSITGMMTTLTSYITIIYYSPNMTNEQYLELSSYIYENTYTNSNIIVTDIMTPADIQAQSQILYDQSLGILAKVSHPRYEFTGEFSNFLALLNFSTFTDDLEMGGVIYIQKDDATFIEAVLLEVMISYDNLTDFGMTFGNSYRLDNSHFIYGDVLGAAAQLGSNLS